MAGDEIRWPSRFIVELDDEIIECKDQQETGQGHNVGILVQDTTTMITMENDAVRDEEDALAAYENVMKDSNKFVITATQDSACFNVPFFFCVQNRPSFQASVVSSA